MLNTNIVFICKTNLNTDGRILNQLNILNEFFPNLRVFFILLADKPTTIKLPQNTHLIEVPLKFRNSKILRPFTVLEFTCKSLILLKKLRPKVLHVHDLAVTLPSIIYYWLNKKSFKMIYDDHELPYGDLDFASKIYLFFENLTLRNADYLIFANEERMKYVTQKYKLEQNSDFFVNLPFEEYSRQSELRIESGRINDVLSLRKLDGVKWIIHQGVIKEQRGEKLLADFIKKLKKPYKVLLLGISDSDYDKFLLKYSIDKDSTYNIGRVIYSEVSKFWELASFSIIMYLPDYLNNKWCAPNRLYLSLSKKIPIIVNKDNPVLSDYTNQLNCGLFIEDLLASSYLERDLKSKEDKLLNYDFEEMEKQQKSKIKKIYSSLF